VVGGDTVDTSTDGSYVITYNVTDSQGLAATEVTRTVTVSTTPTPPPPPGPPGCTNCGGYIHLTIFNEEIEQIATGTVRVSWETNLQATSLVAYDTDSHASSTKPTSSYGLKTEEVKYQVRSHSMVITGLTHGTPYYFRPVSNRSNEQANGIELTITLLPEIIENPCNYLLEYIKFGEQNNPEEVLKLKYFLENFDNAKNLPNTGFYDQKTFDAVKEFQKKYNPDVLEVWGLDHSTGYVYITTKKKINELYCQREFPLSEEQKKEIADTKNLLKSLEERKESGDPSAEEEKENLIQKIGQSEGTTEKTFWFATSTMLASTNLSDITGSKNNISEKESQKQTGLLASVLSFSPSDGTFWMFISLILIVLLMISLVSQIAMWRIIKKKTSGSILLR
ncbi:MAG: DUF5011 domain-containing protein, partial [Candidatus Marinimicrobia bacterium]|nr:DUF5011 domain-containing protein [Candidatus Neomarinimicrobiota bacterium]